MDTQRWYMEAKQLMRWCKANGLYQNGHLKPWLRTAFRSHVARLATLKRVGR
jgi:hypothetical protein